MLKVGSLLLQACETPMVAEFLGKRIPPACLRNMQHIHNFNHLDASKIMHFKRERTTRVVSVLHTTLQRPSEDALPDAPYIRSFSENVLQLQSIPLQGKSLVQKSVHIMP